jgi:hypothetical protein
MNFKVGNHVKINETLKYTKEYIGVNDSMERMCGEIKIIDKYFPNGNENHHKPYVIIDTWMWDLRDLKEAIPSEVPEMKSEYFDPTNLDERNINEKSA